MKKIVVTALCLFCLASCYTQYYYNDIVALKAAHQLYLNLVNNHITQVTAQSLESDNTPAEGFSYKKNIQNNGSLIITNTSLEASGITLTYEHYANGYVTQSVDSAVNETTTVNYQYDNGNNLAFIKTQTEDTSMNMQTTEVHQWFYTGNLPDSMLRIKDNTDTTIVHFIKDDKQNITEELWMKKNRKIEHYYYYYDDKNRLTDIVRYNLKAQQMLPDFVFEYDDNNNILQTTQVPQGTPEYIIWAYIYDNRGLKIKDILYNKQHQLLGTVSYQYQ